MSRHVCILGAGISGLSLAWQLSKNNKFTPLTILERTARAGGWIQTERGDFLFERGPRTFRVKESSRFLELSKELGLENSLIVANTAAKKRYIVRGGGLKKVPMHLLVPALLKEWRVPPLEEEETIYDFAVRRFNSRIASLFFDPMTLGIYAGDIRELSMSACFPALKKWELEYGSLTKALLKKKTVKTSMVSFKEGAQTLVDALAAKLPIHYNQEVLQLRFTDQGVEVITATDSFVADHLFTSLPPPTMAALFKPLDAEISALFGQIAMRGLSVVNVGYRERQLPVKGFGYLVPTQEKEEILGVVFDSDIFPVQPYTRLTVMVKEGVSDPERAALGALKKHLHLTGTPDVIAVHKAAGAIPQYRLGHQALIAALEKKIEERFPRLTLLGNYLRGASVEDCLGVAKEAITKLAL